MWVDGDGEAGWKRPSGKGGWLIVLHAGTADSWVDGAEQVFQAKSSTGDYHNEMNQENFMRWWNTQLLPHIPKHSIIVVDNASYHNGVVESTYQELKEGRHAGLAGEPWNQLWFQRSQSRIACQDCCSSAQDCVPDRQSTSWDVAMALFGSTGTIPSAPSYGSPFLKITPMPGSSKWSQAIPRSALVTCSTRTSQMATLLILIFWCSTLCSPIPSMKPLGLQGLQQPREKLSKMINMLRPWRDQEQCSCH